MCYIVCFAGVPVCLQCTLSLCSLMKPLSTLRCHAPLHMRNGEQTACKSSCRNKVQTPLMHRIRAASCMFVPYLLFPMVLLGKFAPKGCRVFQGLLVHLLVVLAGLDSSSGFILGLYVMFQVKILHCLQKIKTICTQLCLPELWWH